MQSPQTFEAPPHAGVTVQICRGTSACIPCVVERTTPRGLSLRLPGLHDLAIGEAVGLEISDPFAPSGDPPMRTVGKIMEVFLQRSGTALRVALEHPTKADEEAYIAMVERRGGVRHPVPPTFPCRAMLVAPGLGEGVAARIYDVSGNSLGVAIDATDERALAGCFDIEVRIALPGSDRSLSVPCVVRRRTVRGRTGVDVGLQVDESSEGHRAAAAALLELVDLIRQSS